MISQNTEFIMIKNVPFNKIKTVEELKKYDALYCEVLKNAQFESEIELGVNPQSVDQANVNYLSEEDSEYIEKVYRLVAKRLNDSKWLVKTLKTIKEKFLTSPKTIKGVTFDNELF